VAIFIFCAIYVLGCVPVQRFGLFACTWMCSFIYLTTLIVINDTELEMVLRTAVECSAGQEDTCREALRKTKIVSDLPLSGLKFGPGSIQT
jgi:hypothetical protein